jgi:formylglycine-generating enzyme required for sulfatase activity
MLPRVVVVLPHLVVAVCCIVLLSATAAEIVPQTQAWANTDAAFAEFAAAVAESHSRNLLARKRVRLHDGNGVSDLPALTDGEAGERGGDGRVPLDGQPSVITCYLGKATPIFRVGFYTFNIDARANQDYEVRFADNSAKPGVKPEFAEQADLSTGDKVIGPGSGGCYSHFDGADGQPLTPRADWVQFRIWRTYNVAAGRPAHSAAAAGWTAGIELEVWGAADDVLTLSAADKARLEALRRVPREPPFEKKATWQETLQTAREELLRWETTLDVLQAGQAGVVLGGWYVLGPLEDASVIGAVDQLRTVDLKATYGEAKVAWRALAGLADGQLCDVARLVGAKAGQTIFLARPVTVEQQFDGQNPFCIGVGLEDGWVMLTPPRSAVGGRQRPAYPNQYLLRITSAPGDYTLLSRLTVQADGSAPLWLTPHCPKGRPAAGTLGTRLQRRGQALARVRREFTDPVSTRQMDWEEWDSTWQSFQRLPMAGREYFLTDWSPGMPTTLAREVVAAAARRTAALQRELATIEPAIREHTAAWIAGAAQPGASPAPDTLPDLAAVRQHYYDVCTVQEAMNTAHRIESVRLAVADQAATFGAEYPKAPEYLAAVQVFQGRMDALWPALLQAPATHLGEVLALGTELAAAARNILLDNPLLRFDKLLMARGGPWFASNWGGPNNLGGELVVLSPVRPDGQVTTIYKGGRISDFDLHFDGERILFSDGQFLHEIRADGSGLRRISTQEDPHVHHFDGCYLPDDEQILFVSTACEQAVPCTGEWYVGNLHVMKTDGSGERRLAFDQDHDWNPCMLNNGRVVYTRWEYTDIPHYFSRLLFQMNPDGTGQSEYYGSNSYWPNAMYWPRPIPGAATELACIVSGHHGVSREGALILLDPARGRHEADGVVQQIPGRGKTVEPVIEDGLVGETWPRFAAPYPLAQPDTNLGAGKYFLVNCRESPWAPWGIYLVDVFDNLTPLLSGPYCSAVPLRPRPRPPVIPARVKLDRTSGFVYMADVYRGPGIAGCPPGTVKALRLGAHHYRYGGNGDTYASSYDGGWDVKRILGTVPVNPDGSAFFEVPANTPVFVQPLDADGKALQTMRSWFTVMPGETLSCVGCHEPQNSAAPPGYGRAGRSAPEPVRPWYGTARGFGFDQEVQPVLDRRCAGCHNGQPGPAGRPIPDLRAKALHPEFKGRYSPAYLALHPYVRRAGYEADYHMPKPAEFNADTSPLVQLLRKGHHGVQLAQEEWDRLYTWIDFNVPYAPTWRQSHQPPADEQVARRAKYLKLYANVDDHNEDPLPAPAAAAFIAPAESARQAPEAVALEGWPLTAEQAAARQSELGWKEFVQDLGGGVSMSLVPVPAGRFVRGDPAGPPDEQEQTAVASVDRPFYMSRCEVTNEQYARFDPAHDSAYIDARNKDRVTRGYPVNGPRQPVVRVSWAEATAFCEWLSKLSGRVCALPTEDEWEWACRAGSGGRWPFGEVAAGLPRVANVADRSLHGWGWGRCETGYDDGVMFSADVGAFPPNAWGLCDLIGNVAEWTAGTYGQDDLKVVRGGSWNDTLAACRSASRWRYPSWQPVYNVGFRVVVRPAQALANR